MYYKKIIEKNFKFLIDHGYKKKNCSEYTDIILQYTGKHCLTVWRVLQISGGYDIEQSVDENFARSYIKTTITIDQDEIYKSSLFNKNDLSSLYEQIKECKSDKEKIVKFASFIQKNLSLLE